MATSLSHVNPPSALDQGTADGDFLSPESVEETLCGKMRKLREDELFAAMDCMGDADAPPPIEKRTEQKTAPEAKVAPQAYGQVRRTHGY